MERCKCCKQIVPPRGIPPDLQLSPMQELIWEAVRQHPGISGAEIFGLVYPGEFDGGPMDVNGLRVQIARMNKRLRHLKIEITGRDRRGYKVRGI